MNIYHFKIYYTPVRFPFQGYKRQGVPSIFFTYEY